MPTGDELLERPRRSPLERGRNLQRQARKWAKARLLKWRRSRVSRKRLAVNRRMTYALSGLLIALLAIFMLLLQHLNPSLTGRHLSLDQLSALADEERILSANFLDEDAIVTGRYAPPNPPTTADISRRLGYELRALAIDQRALDRQLGLDVPVVESDEAASTAAGLPTSKSKAPGGEGEYWLAYPASDAMTSFLVVMAADSGAVVDVDPQSGKGSVRTVATFLLPLMILANLFALFISLSKGGGSGIGEVMMFGSIGKGKGRHGKRSKGAVTFGDVAGADEAVAELKEVRDYLFEPERYEEIGAMPPKGVLLVGPPGCGKTLIAKAIAGEAGVPFFSVAGAEFVESLVGVGAARVRDLFQRVRAVAPAIVFIDELDAAGRKRGTGGGGGGSDEREQTLNQLLVEMDGFDVSSGIVVVGATNRPDILDPALLRPGRFDRHVTVDQPDLHGRQLILELHAHGKPIEPTVDFSYLAKRTPGFSGADLANVVNEAALLTVREGKIEIETPELEEAIQRVLAGPKKRGRVLSPEERKRAAYHESGHAIVAAASGRLEEIHRVSILSRGRGIGVASIQRETDALLLTRSQLYSQMVTSMGGIAAEQLIFGEPSTGAERDLEQATDLAFDMIGRFGMGRRRRRLLSKEVEAFLGDELSVAQISGMTHQEMEKEVDDLLEDSEREATRLLDQHREVLDTLAARLEVEETLEGTDLEAVLALVRPEVSLFGGLGDAPSGNGSARPKTPSKEP